MSSKPRKATFNDSTASSASGNWASRMPRIAMRTGCANSITSPSLTRMIAGWLHSMSAIGPTRN